jgi:hypothetical protein
MAGGSSRIPPSARLGRGPQEDVIPGPSTTRMNSELRGQRDVDHVRKWRLAPRTHYDARLTCGYAMGKAFVRVRYELFSQAGLWGLSRGQVTEQ